MGVSKYPEEFRNQAVVMVLEKGIKPYQVASELGVHEKSVKDWVKKHSNNQRSEYLRIQELERENKQLKKELHRSKEAVEILKKTAAILSNP
jgi:transposase